MCTQLVELERALQVASIRRKTAQTALAHHTAQLAAHDSLEQASAEIVDLESEIEQHITAHNCRTSGASYFSSSESLSE